MSVETVDLQKAIEGVKLAEILQALNETFNDLNVLNIMGAQSELHAKMKQNISVISQRLAGLHAMTGGALRPVSPQIPPILNREQKRALGKNKHSRKDKQQVNGVEQSKA